MPDTLDRLRGARSTLGMKTPVLVATIGDITLAGLQTIDGIALAENDRILVKNQTDATRNGIYLASTSNWGRALDFDSASDFVQGTTVMVAAGLVGAGTIWRTVFTGTLELGVTEINFTEFASGSAPPVPGTNDLGYYIVTEFGAVGDASTDCTNAIQDAIDAAGAADGGIVFFPPGIYNITGQLVLPSSHFADSGIILQGSGRAQTRINLVSALAAGVAMLFREDTTTVVGGGTRDIWFNANNLADYVAEIRAGKGGYYESTIFQGALVTEFLGGDAGTPRFFENKFFDCWFRNENAVIASRSEYNFRLIGFGTDNEIIRCSGNNARFANFRIDPGGNALIGTHAYGSPSTTEATYCYQDLGGTRFIGCYADGFTSAGFHVDTDECSIIGCHFFWPATTTGDGILVASAKTRIQIMGNVYVSKPAARSKVVLAGTVPTDSLILDSVMSGDSTNIVLGHTQNANGLSNARLQVVGTDFAGSALYVARYSTDANGPSITLYKSRATTPSSFGVVASSDALGQLNFAADDGAAARTGARIQANIDGTPGSSDVPTRMALMTAADGASFPTERLRLDSRGNAIVPFNGAALSTAATDGFFYLPTVASTSTAAGPVPTPASTFAGAVAALYSTGSHRLWIYSGTWRGVTLSSS